MLVRGVLAFMVIASQHPIVSGLSGGSNLGAEVVAFCDLADQTIVISSGEGGFSTLSSPAFIEEWKQVNVANTDVLV